ncbi:MAG TPA: quinone oxidoreductase [Kofleriaceae bacterium]|nr:quinone oxidoreductase [Kofleriaceae bacterium]
MKAIRAHRHGGPEVLQMDELPDAAPGTGEARVRVEAAGVNFIDTYHRTGLYKMELPVRLGQEGAGVVEAVGDGVDGALVGERVAWAGAPGSYATHVVAPVAKLVRVPAGVGADVAAAAMLQGMTAHYLVRSTYAVKRGDRVLMHAAAGGVGLLVCQLAAAAGAHVIGTVSTDAKAAAARAAGAAEVVRYDQVASIRDVQVAYDGVGATTWRASLDALAVRGMLVLFGNASGPVPPVDPFLLSPRSLFLTRPVLGHYTATRDELTWRAGEIFDLIAKGELAITIDRQLPLDQAAEAHRLLESRATSGKLLLLP